MLYVCTNKNHHHNTNKKEHNAEKIDFQIDFYISIV